MERGKDNGENLPGSLQSLRGEFDGIHEMRRERRIDMPQAQVTMDVRKVNDKVSVIDVKGELTAFAEGVLMQAYNQALEYMNSSGIGLLVTLLIRVNREKQRLLTFGLSEHYRNIFQITRLDDAIGIYDSEEAAVQAADSM
jgi:anti-sigma B factor antagonist